ncbi:ADP-glyceromanno-heptose 6-epimerase [soil metagenome]
MNKDALIVVTGAAGFIGSCMAGYLNEQGYENLILVDDFGPDEKLVNLADKSFLYKIERDIFFNWMVVEKPDVRFFFHLGARTDTTEFDYAVHQRLNVEYSQNVWEYCTNNNVGLVYASSAATYGAGEFGYKDDHDIIDKLQPLNPYGVSKNEFDKWAVNENEIGKKVSGKKFPPFWAGLKFFNVYGPFEYHKARMASVIFHAYNQIKENGFVKLFRSHKEGFKDGEQLRDFIYVKDVVKVCFWFMMQSDASHSSDGDWSGQPASGLYNLGTGKARTFNDLVKATFDESKMVTDIRYIEMPEDIREKYQYFTEADMQKLRNAGYSQPFYLLEEGVREYVREYLINLKV